MWLSWIYFSSNYRAICPAKADICRFTGCYHPKLIQVGKKSVGLRSMDGIRN